MPQIQSKLINSTTSSSNQSQKSEKHIANNQTRRLLEFIQKQKATKDVRNDHGIQPKSIEGQKKKCKKLIIPSDALNGNGIDITTTTTITNRTGIERDALKVQKLGKLIEFFLKLMMEWNIGK